MKSAVLIPVRTGSTRLTQKSLLEIKNRTLIEHLIDRVKQSVLPEHIILCTTQRTEDEIFIDIAKRNNILSFQGEENDILNRFQGAIEKYELDICINVDGDDLFCEPSLIDKSIDFLTRNDIDFIEWKGLPYGTVPVGYKATALKLICKNKAEKDTQTNWGRFFTETNLVKCKILEEMDKDLNYPDIRMTIDYIEDFEFANAIFTELYQKGRVFTLKEIMSLLKVKPEIVNINKNIQDKYYSNLRENQAKIRMKSRSEK